MHLRVCSVAAPSYVVHKQMQIVVKDDALASSGGARKGFNTHLERKLRRVRREARTLALRTATCLLIGIVCFLVAQPLCLQGAVFACVVLRHAGLCVWWVLRERCRCGSAVLNVRAPPVVICTLPVCLDVHP